MAPTDPISDSGDSHYDPHHSGMHDDAHAGGANGNGAIAGGGMLSRLTAQVPSTQTLNWNYGPPARPEILSAKPNPVELLHAVRRRWPLAVGLGLAVSGLLCGLMWYLIPVRYEAYATIKVASSKERVFGETLVNSEDFKLFKATQQQLVTSNPVMQAVVRDRAINQLATIRAEDDPIVWLQDNLVVEYPGDTEIMRVSIRTEKMKDSETIVNKVVEIYLREIVGNEKTKQVQNEGQLERTAEQLDADYAREMQALALLEKQNNASGSEEAMMRKQLAVDELRILMAQKNQLQSELTNNALVIKLLETKEKTKQTDPPEVVIDMELEKDQEIVLLRQQLAAYQQHLAAIRSSATGPNATPHVTQVQHQILQLEEQIEEIKHQRMPRLMELFRLNSGNGPDPHNPLSLDQLAEQRKHIEAQLATVTADVNAKREEVTKMHNFSAAVDAAKERIAILKEHKNMVQLEVRRIEVERFAPERIQKLIEAVPLGDGDAIRKYLAVVFTGLLSFFGVALAVAVLEFQARKVNSVNEVNDGLGIRVVGELPNVRGRAFRRVRGGQGQNVLKALMAERIDGTRTALIHTTAIDPPRVVMITSADPHEGKTTTSTQLAASLARSGRRTLLIDADIRNPGVHRVFEMPQDPGLCELLRGEADRDAVIHPTRTANLWLLPSGRCDLRSVQALSGAYLGSTIAALSVQFDYLIIDAGPVLKVADPLLVGQHVDAVIISVLKDVSRVPRVYEAVERLRSVGITVLGSVVNGVKDDVARHGVELLMAETPRQQEPEAAETT